jgi:hypothetical protein
MAGSEKQDNRQGREELDGDGERHDVLTLIRTRFIIALQSS